MDPKINDKLRSLYKENAAAKAFFAWIEERERSSRTTKARVAANRTEQPYSEIVDLFRNFDELRLGSFMVGRRGAETRFEWDFDVKSLARIASGKAEDAEEISPDTEDDDVDDEDAEATLEHTFNLRADLTVVVRLPENFTAREADRLAAWIKSLPFEP